MSTPGAITTSATLPIAEPTSGPADTSAAAGGMPGSLGEFLQVHKQVSVVDSTQPISFDAVGMQMQCIWLLVSSVVQFVVVVIVVIVVHFYILSFALIRCIQVLYL